jgi:hypothetical protein
VQQGVEVGAVRGVGTCPEARDDLNGPTRGQHRLGEHRGEVGPHPLGLLGRGGRVEVRQHDEELVAAEARDQVPAP